MLVTVAQERHLVSDMFPSFALSFAGRLSRALESVAAPPTLLGEVRISRPWTMYRARAQLAQLIERETPDIVICHGVWSQAVFGPAVRAARVGLAVFLHNVTRGTHWLERWAALTRPDSLLTNSEYTAACASRLYPHVTPDVLYCPVPPAPLITDAERQRIRTELGVPVDSVVVIQASRLERLKGHRTHLETLARLRHLPDWISLMVGGPQRPQEESYYAEIQRYASELGIASRVRFLGQRDDVPRLLAGADIHLQPNSAPESFGIAFVEAMRAGRPVVTRRMGALPEIVTPQTGFLVERSSELVGTVSKLLADKQLRQSLGAAGRLRARELCDPRKQLTTLKSLLESSARKFQQR